MHRSIESDDFRGDYGAKFPLISQVGHPPRPPLPAQLKRVMNSGEGLPAGLDLTEGDMCETAPTCDF